MYQNGQKIHNKQDVGEIMYCFISISIRKTITQNTYSNANTFIHNLTRI